MAHRAGDATAVPDAARDLGIPWFVDSLPRFWVETRFFEVELWQWLALPALGLLVAVVAQLAGSLLGHLLAALARRSAGDGDDRLVDAARAPLQLLLAVLLFASGRRFLGLAVPVERAIDGLALAMAVLALAWLLVRALDIGCEALAERLRATGRVGAAGLVPLGRRLLNVVLGTLAAIAVVQNLGFDVTGILAGLGVGGLAIALAAQKTVENLFGGVSLAADQPVRVGDFCRFGDKLGTIEAIGLRSTRVRTLVTVPNADYSAMQIESYAQRDRIWLSAVLGLRYETTPDQLRHVIASLRRVLLDHPRVDPDPARVRLVQFGAYSLDLEVFAYVRTSDYGEFLAIREEIFPAFIDVVAQSGSGFAFPSRTIYAAPDAGLDAEQARAAEAEVRRGRAGGHST